jgi:hypothetical protein
VYAGLVELEDTIQGLLITRSASLTPTDSDALPTFRVYGPDGLVTSGTCSRLETGTITGATNATPIVITSAGHGLTSGSVVTISGVGGNTAANGTAAVTRIDADTFSLDGSSGNGAYTSGGSWHPTGAYTWSVDALGADGFDAGENYAVLLNWAMSSAQRAEAASFTVV